MLTTWKLMTWLWHSMSGSQNDLFLTVASVFLALKLLSLPSLSVSAACWRIRWGFHKADGVTFRVPFRGDLFSSPTIHFSKAIDHIWPNTDIFHEGLCKNKTKQNVTSSFYFDWIFFSSNCFFTSFNTEPFEASPGHVTMIYNVSFGNWCLLLVSAKKYPTAIMTPTLITVALALWPLQKLL